MPKATPDRARSFERMFDLLERLETLALPIPQPVSQLDHSLQVATRAWRAGAGAELILGALMHDVGRLLRPEAHGLASAELIRPFVSDAVYGIVRIHDHIALQFVAPEPGLNSDAALYAREPWFPAARLFVEQWDRYGFDPDARVLPVEFFRPFLADTLLGARPPVGAGSLA